MTTQQPGRVLVVGGGPVGMSTAVMLAHAGIPVTVLERWRDPYLHPRACGIDHEAVRILSTGIGLREGLETILEPVMGEGRTYEFHNGTGEKLLEIDWNRPGVSGFAEMSTFHQPELEQLIAEQARRPGSSVEIRRGVTVTGVRQSSDSVQIDLEAPDGSRERCDGAYLVAADGANSRVREQLGITQTDLGFAFDWLVVDVVPHHRRVWTPYVVQHCDPRRPATSVGSGPGRRRWEFMRLPGETIDELNRPETAWSLLEPWQINPSNSTLDRHTVYRFRGRWADTWRQGRVLLAGDAAHLMPPFLAQGLCSGLRDAIALSWRLALVLRGSAGDSLLDSYGVERTAHVRTIIEQAVDIGRLICELDPAAAASRDEQMKSALADPRNGLRPPPAPVLGTPGVTTDQPIAGSLFPQGRVSTATTTGLLDEFTGPGWIVLSMLDEPDNLLSQPARATLDLLAARRVRLTVEGGAEQGHDVDHTYASWFAANPADIVIIRPDFYVFGTARAADADALVGRLAQALSLTSVSHGAPLDSPMKYGA